MLQACGYIATPHLIVKLFCWKHVGTRWTGPGARSCIYLVQGRKVHELLQYTMFCAGAVYKDNSFSFVKENSNRRFHTVTHVLAFGDDKLSDRPLQQCLLVFLESSNSEEKSLIFPWRGWRHTTIGSVTDRKPFPKKVPQWIPQDRH